jgi:cytoskeletal protein CcmA (bactofilin family)
VKESANPLPDDGMNHLDEMTCLLYIERQLDRARAQQVSEHAQECVPCRTLLRALERESRLLTRAMLEEEREALPARLAEFQERARRSMQWIWGVAFGLAATGVYALYTEYVVRFQRNLEQAGFGGSNLLSLLIFQGALWKGWQSMITLLEVLALLTLAGFALALFRRRMRRGSVLVLVVAGLCASLTLPNAAAASEMRKGDSVGVSKNETIKGDIFLFGQRVRVDGNVEGDVFVFAKHAEVNGHVGGDVFAFAQLLDVNGQVDGNIRGFTNTLTIRGTVAKNVLTFDETVNVEPAGKIGGSLTLFMETLSLDGTLGRDLLVAGKHPIISGKVGGEIKAKVDTFTINAGAQVDGPIHVESNSPPEVSSQAKLASPVEYHKLEHKPRYMEGHYYVWQVIWAAAFVLFGLVLFQLMPQFSRQSVENAERYGASFGLGVLVFFGVPIAAVIACITVVGLFVGISAFLVWYAALYYAQIIVGGLVGQWILGRTRELWPLVGRMAVGVIIVRLSTTIPEIGGWIKFAVILWGLGAISLTIYRRFQPAMAPAVPSAPYVSPLPPTTTVGGAQPA